MNTAGCPTVNNRRYKCLMPRSAEQIFSVIMLFYAAAAVWPFFLGRIDPLSPSQTDPIQVAVTIALYSVAFCFIVVRWRSVIESARKIKWIVALVLVAIASTAWSLDPSLTLRASASFGATTIFGVYFGTRYSPPQQLRLLAWTCSLVVLLSFFFAIFLPKYGIDQVAFPGAWQGVFAHKNVLARAMVLALLVFVFVQPKRFQSLRWLGVAASLALLLLSRSVTGMIVCAAIVSMLALYKCVGARNVVTIPLIVVGLLLVGLLLFPDFSAAQVFQLVGRSSDLTGRTELWSALLVSISKRPWLGYGFSAFWGSVNGESESVRDAARWAVPHGHNGIVDLMLQLGVLGLATFAVGYFVFWRRALRFLSRVPGRLPVWLCTYLLFMLLYNLSESSLLARHDIFWILYTSTAVSLFPTCFRQISTDREDL